MAKDIIAKDGFFSLYKGLNAGLLRQATYTTTRLGIFQVISEKVGGGAGGPGGRGRWEGGWSIELLLTSQLRQLWIFGVAHAMGLLEGQCAAREFSASSAPTGAPLCNEDFGARCRE